MLSKIIGAIFLIAVVIWGITQFVKAEGNVGVAVSNNAGLAVGECIQDNGDLDEIACDSAKAVYRIDLRATDAEGTNCAPTFIGIIEEGEGAETIYWCVSEV